MNSFYMEQKARPIALEEANDAVPTDQASRSRGKGINKIFTGIAPSAARQTKVLATGIAALAFVAPATVATAATAPAQNYDAHSIAAHAFKTAQHVCYSNGVCCTLTAQGNIADCGFNETPMNPGAQTGPWPGTGGREFPCDPNAPFNICN